MGPPCDLKVFPSRFDMRVYARKIGARVHSLKNTTAVSSRMPHSLLSRYSVPEIVTTQLCVEGYKFELSEC